MRKASMRCLVFLAACLFPVTALGVEALKFRHRVSVYTDDREGALKQPEGVACNDGGLLIVADTGNGRLLQYSFKDGTLEGGSEIRVPQLPSPLRVRINSKGEILAVDGRGRNIVRLSSDGKFNGYLQPKGMPPPTSYIPKSLAIDEKDNLYILDVFGGRVLVLDLSGEYQRHIKFPEGYGFISDLSIDLQGGIYLIDSPRAVVYSAKQGSASFSPLTESLQEFVSFPTSLTVDNKGRIYIVDQNGGGIAILGQDGSFLGRRLGRGWKEGLLYYPSQLCVNKNDEVFIADRSNNRIQIFTIVK